MYVRETLYLFIQVSKYFFNKRVDRDVHVIVEFIQSEKAEILHVTW